MIHPSPKIDYHVVVLRDTCSTILKQREDASFFGSPQSLPRPHDDAETVIASLPRGRRGNPSIFIGERYSANLILGLSNTRGQKSESMR